MKLKTIAMTGVMSLAGLGLIGAGAHAVFTTSTTSTQNVTAGTLSVVLYGPSGSSGNGTTALTLAAVGPTASSFTTGDQSVQMYNNGNITASEITEAIGTNYPASALAAELYVCETSFGQGGSPQVVIYNGPLSGALYTQAIAGTIAPLASDYYTINVYAGSEPTACGVTPIGSTAVAGTSAAPDLTNSVEGESLNVTVTVGYSG